MRASSLLARTGAAAAAAVMASAGLVAAASAASAAGHHPLDATTLSIKNKPIAHSKHHASTISGTLRDELAHVAGETITLESRPVGQAKWTAGGTMVTDSNGSVAFTVAPAKSTQYKLVFAGDSTFRHSASNVVTIKVAKA
jgi:hypothetical protein